jgi:hypothetical protein
MLTGFAWPLLPTIRPHPIGPAGLPFSGYATAAQCRYEYRYSYFIILKYRYYKARPVLEALIAHIISEMIAWTFIV